MCPFRILFHYPINHLHNIISFQEKRYNFALINIPQICPPKQIHKIKENLTKINLLIINQTNINIYDLILEE